MQLGYPRFQYLVPYNEDWYIIITSESFHFYFNKQAKKSYWQLHDIFEDFKDIDKDSFLKSIDYEYISLLVARCNGLKGIDGYYLKSKVSDVAKDKDLHPLNDEDKSENEDQTIDIKGHTASEVDETEKDGESSDNDGREDYSGHQEKESESDLREEHNSEVSGGIIAGYSSDEDGSDERLISDAHGSEEENDLNLLISDEDQGNLDLALSDDEEADQKKQEFFSLLELFKDRISIFDTWELIEEDNIDDFVKHPEFFNVSETKQRANFFNEWCKSQQITNQESPDIFPTDVVLYLRILQLQKNDVRKLFFKEFSDKYSSLLAPIQLSHNELEKFFRTFKVMILDFSKYERERKKSSNYDSSMNLKKQKLDEFLLENSDKFRNSTIIEASSSSAFENWVNLANKMKISKEIIENPINFIVGDDKRFQSYVGIIQKVNR
ncbi:uncharacterized protein PRCAT00005384001 [Priceomyces carsonii]|uniref:uncharacterized protein n=1 Tax=Priceomyces carsonii TaxID=28549 RepID=UPI002ED82B85|nr:unnamed protein product [Priceomyces carsonii]